MLLWGQKHRMIRRNRTDMEEKKYKTWWQPVAIIFSILYLSGIFFQDNFWSMENLTAYLPLFVVVIAGLLILARFTHIIITPDKKLKNINFGYHRRIFHIRDITEIKKIPLYFNLGWGFGYRLIIYFKQDNGQIDKTEINLNHYRKETITDLLKTLFEINSNIKLDKEVQKMLEKKQK